MKLLLTTKKIVKKIDDRFFGKFIQRKYEDYIINHGKSYAMNKKNNTVNEPIYDMVLMQVDMHENKFLEYSYYDLPVRLLAVENYYGKNDCGFELYKKMHSIAGNYGQENESEDYYNNLRLKNKKPVFGKKKEQHSIEQFENLIRSIEENGFDNNTVIMSDRNLLNMNGSHRFTMALYKDIDFINVEIHNVFFRRTYTKQWFWEHGFSLDEIRIIDSKQNEILKKCKEKIGLYKCILFPPAEEYFDEITDEIRNYDPNNISVVEVQDYSLYTEDFVCLLKTLYAFDSIKATDLERKIYYIKKSSYIIDNKVTFRLLKIKISDPLYRVKVDNGMPESVTTVRLKAAIRERFKGKDSRLQPEYNKDYHHDVIIHSTDNYLSNRAFDIIFSIDRDISGLFDQIKNKKYCLIESSSDKIHFDFPKSFYFGEDIDILVLHQDIEEISNIIYQYCKKKYTHEWVNVRLIQSDMGKRVYVEIRNVCIIMFDLMSDFSGLRKEFISNCIINKEKNNNINYLCKEDEIVFRMWKYIQNPRKTWHKKYICDNCSKDKNYWEAFENPDMVAKIMKKMLGEKRNN